jgi:hypothetical protein
LEKSQQKPKCFFGFGKSQLLLEKLNTKKLSHSMTKFLSIYYLTYFVHFLSVCLAFLKSDLAKFTFGLAKLTGVASLEKAREVGDGGRNRSRNR